MRQSGRNGNKLFRLINAFEKDGYTVKNFINRFDRIGLVAEHNIAFNYDTGKKKRAYYLEGSSYEMGYMMGLMAEKEISAMAVDYTEDIVFSFVMRKNEERANFLGGILVSVLHKLASISHAELPLEIREEIRGMYEGCKESNNNTRVTLDHLIVLNCGIDILCSLVYTGNFLMRKMTHLKSSELRVPIMCNAFSVFGSAAGNAHYFGRDFMFPGANIFQDTASLVIYNPEGLSGRKAIPFAGITAPGMAGTIAAVNKAGVGLGVDMVPAANCSPERIGTNSLLLARLCVQYGKSAEDAVNIIKETPRGVSWLYIIADGTSDRSCVVEAGSSENLPNCLDYPPVLLKNLLPDKKFVRANKSAEFQNGIMVRWNNYEYPQAYLQYNKGLWKHYNKKSNALNYPSVFYFAPQRETRKDVLIATNHYIIPEMRFFAMHPWTSKIASSSANDVQWRYDELNNAVLNAIDEKGHIDYDTAKEIIDFLSPYRKFPGYYAGNPKSQDGKEIRIEGCTSIFDLKRKTIESHFGYYCDEWVKISLSNYLE